MAKGKRQKLRGVRRKGERGNKDRGKREDGRKSHEKTDGRRKTASLGRRTMKEQREEGRWKMEDVSCGTWLTTLPTGLRAVHEGVPRHRLSPL